MSNSKSMQLTNYGLSASYKTKGQQFYLYSANLKTTLSPLRTANMRGFFEGIDAELSEDRQELFTKLNLLASQMDDQTLELYLKLGDVLNAEHKKTDFVIINQMSFMCS